MDYPYPILDWIRADEYPAADDFNPFQWAWEFLRRDPEYQRLFDKFKVLPDFYTLDDGYTSNKNGKWKGTPWVGFRFFDGVACFYADPPPEAGESYEEYDQRTGGDVMPFAHYFNMKFKIEPYPPDPTKPLPDICYFSDMMCKDGEQAPPHHLGERIFPPESQSSAWVWESYFSYLESIRNNYKVPILFDVRYPIEKQLAQAKAWLAGEQKWFIENDPAGIDAITNVKYQPAQFPRYIRLLDAEAAGASVPEMAAAIYPGERDARDTGFRVSTKVRQNLKAAKRLRDGGYWEMLI